MPQTPHTGLRDVWCHGNAANNTDVSDQQAYKGKKIKELEPQCHTSEILRVPLSRLKSDRRVSGRKPTQSSVTPHYSNKTAFIVFLEAKYLYSLSLNIPSEFGHKAAPDAG